MSVPLQATRQRALSDVVVQVATRIANLALGIFVTAVLVRTLGAAGYGQWLTMLTVFTLLGYFTSFGLSSVAVREASQDPEREGEWIGALVMVQVLMALPVIVLGVGALALVSENHTMFMAGLVLLLQIPVSIGNSLAIAFQLRMDNRVPMVLLTANSVLWGAAVLIVNALGGGLLAMAVAMTATTAVTSFLQVFLSLRIQKLQRPSRASMIRLVKVGAPLGISGLLVIAYARIDQVIVFEQIGATAAGEYGAAYRILEQAHFIPVSVLTTLAPMMAALWPANRDRLVRVGTMAAELLSIGSFGALAFTCVAATPLMRFLFGEELIGGAKALPVLGGAFVMICFGYLTSNLLLVLGLERKQVIVTSVGLVVNVIGNLLLVPHYGFVAAAWITLVTEIAVVGVGLAYGLRKLGHPRPGWGRLPRIALAGIVLYGGLYGIHQAGAGLFPLVVVTLVAYPALLLLLRGVSTGDVRELLLRRPGAA